MRQKDPVLTFLLTFCVKTIRQRRIADSTEKKHKKMKQKVSIFLCQNNLPRQIDDSIERRKK